MQTIWNTNSGEKKMKSIILFLMFSTFVYPQMKLDWAATYRGPYSGGLDLARAVAVDDSGNVYITGTSQLAANFFECVTIKYNTFGDTVWLRHYQRPGSSNTHGQDIKIDDSGFIYVAAGGIIKYNSGGNLIWQKYDSIIYQTIVLDSSGNIYGGGSSLQRRLTAGKYDRNGNRIWKKSYTFPGSDGNDMFRGMVLDKFDNIIITGPSKSITTFYDYATVKYSKDGNLIWSRRYNGPSSYSSDYSYGVTSDLLGNIYVTGFSMDSLDNSNCFTIKYDSSGNTLWVKRIQTSENIANGGYNLVTDSSQNVFIAGRLGGWTATIKLDVNGKIIWSRLYPEGDLFTANWPVIILDSAYNVHVSANSTPNANSTDYAAIKYDSSGNQIYVVTYDYVQPVSFDYAYAMTLDKKGNLYLTGEFSGAYGHYGTVKFSPILTATSGNYFIIPDKFKLDQNYPNPFNPLTTISYTVPKTSIVKLKVFDITGKEIHILVSEQKTAGSYNIIFDASELASGIYFYTLTAGEFKETKRMLLIK